ncbi:MAG: hypothetical protein HZY76_18420 [Anaerolineae bacterium]|nr:MAG: hypothetical protein HZY76_18420 [Anaerolineae bacterium]
MSKSIQRWRSFSKHLVPTGMTLTIVQGATNAPSSSYNPRACPARQPVGWPEWSGVRSNRRCAPRAAAPHAEWTIQYHAPAGITLRGITMLSTQVGYAVGGPSWGITGSPYIVKTTNGGVDWLELPLPPAMGGWQGPSPAARSWSA